MNTSEPRHYLILNFDNDPKFTHVDWNPLRVTDIDLLPELYYELGAELSFLASDNIEDKSLLIVGLGHKEPEMLDEITQQCRSLIERLLSNNTIGDFEITFPCNYNDWLTYSGNPTYKQIASELARQSNKITFDIAELYDQLIRESIVPKVGDFLAKYTDINKVVISCDSVTPDSTLVRDIIAKYPMIQHVDKNDSHLLLEFSRIYDCYHNLDLYINCLETEGSFNSLMLAAIQLIKKDRLKDPRLTRILDKALDKNAKKAGQLIQYHSELLKDPDLHCHNIYMDEWLDSDQTINSYSSACVIGRMDNASIEELKQFNKWHSRAIAEGDRDARWRYAYTSLVIIKTETKKFLNYSDDTFAKVETLYNDLKDGLDHECNQNDQTHTAKIFEAMGLYYSALMLLSGRKIKSRGLDEAAVAAVKSDIEKYYKSAVEYLTKCNVSTNEIEKSYDTFSNFISQAETRFKEEAARRAEELAQAEIRRKEELAQAEIRRKEELARQAEKNARLTTLNRKISELLEMDYIPGGEFTMGEGTSDQTIHEHKVSLSPFMVGNISQPIFELVLNCKKGIRSSWDDFNLFIKNINEITGKNYSLVSEAQCEFMVRNSNIIPDRIGNRNSGYLELRNIWCADDYAEYPFLDQIDPIIITESDVKVVCDRDSLSPWKRSKGYKSYLYEHTSLIVRPATPAEIEEAARRQEEEEAIRKREEEETRHKQEEAQRKEKEENAEREKIRQKNLKRAEELATIVTDFYNEYFMSTNLTYTQEEKKALAVKPSVMAIIYGLTSSGTSNDYECLNLSYSDGNRFKDVKRKARDIESYYTLSQVYSISDTTHWRSKSFFVSKNDYGSEESFKLIETLTVFSRIFEESEYKSPAHNAILSEHDKAEMQQLQKLQPVFESTATPAHLNQYKCKRLDYMLDVSNRFMRGDESTNIPKNERFAFILLQKAASEGNKEAKRRLINCYRNGIGTHIDHTKEEQLCIEAGEPIKSESNSKTNQEEPMSNGLMGFITRMFGKKK